MDFPNDSPVEALVRAHLLDRSARLGRTETVAYVDGWMAALELMERADLWMPDAPEELREALFALVSRVRAAQARALEDED